MRLFFDHIPRTGASAFCHSLRAALGAGAVVSGPLAGNLSSVLHRFASLPAICGVVELAPGDALPADRLSATLLRDPLERALSCYTFLRHDLLLPGAAGDLVEMCRARTLAQCLEAREPRLDSHLRNGQARHLALLAGGVDEEDEAALLERALQALEGFALVGVTESVADFVDLAGARLGWGLLPQPPVLRAASHPMPPASLDAQTLRTLREGNRVDAELHRVARERFARDWRVAFRELVAAVGPRELPLPQRPPASSTDAPVAGVPPLTDFAASMALIDRRPSMEADAMTSLEVEVRNDSAALWHGAGDKPVRVSYHWLDEDGGMSVYDGERTRLPYDLGPGDSVRLHAAVRAPATAGRYVLRLGLVQEGVAWFEAEGTPGPELEVEVASAAASAA